MPITGDAALGAGMGLLGIGLNLVGGNRQQQQQQQLMNMQMENQMALNLQGQKIQQENWDYTNYENQRKHMENAGLNVGLMYGQSGGGGQSMGSQGGGSAAGGNAPQNQAPQIMAQLLQSQMMQSQIKLNEAQANKANAEADYTGGAQTGQTLANADKIVQEIENLKTKNANEIQEGIKTKAEADVAEENQQIELLTKYLKANNIEIEGNKLTKEIWAIGEKMQQGAYSLDTDRINARTNQKNATTNRINSAIGEQNADTNTMNAMTNATRVEIEALLGKMNIDQKDRAIFAQGLTQILSSAFRPATIINKGK